MPERIAFIGSISVSLCAGGGLCTDDHGCEKKIQKRKVKLKIGCCERRINQFHVDLTQIFQTMENIAPKSIKRQLNSNFMIEQRFCSVIALAKPFNCETLKCSDVKSNFHSEKKNEIYFAVWCDGAVCSVPVSEDQRTK